MIRCLFVPGAALLAQIIKRKFRVRAEKYHMTGGTGSLRYMAPEVRTEKPSPSPSNRLSA